MIGTSGVEAAATPLVEQRRWAIAGGVAAVLAAIAAAMPHAAPEQRLLLAALVLAVLGPTVVRVVWKRFDLFEPQTLFAVAYGMMFIARPIAMLIDKKFLYGIANSPARDTRPAFTAMLVAALVGALAFQIGYAAIRPSKAPAALRDRWNDGLALDIATGLVIAGILLFVAFLEHAGGAHALRAILHGKSAHERSLLKSSTAYLYDGIYLVVPGALIALAVAGYGDAARRRKAQVIAALGILVVVMRAAPSGGRLLLLALAGALFAYVYLKRNRRPGLVASLIVIVVAFFALTLLREVRAEQNRASSGVGAIVTRTVRQPLHEIDRLMTGGDTSMASGLALELEIIPSRIDYRYGGATIGDALVRPIPRLLWKGKPLPPREELAVKLWPKAFRTGFANPEFSVLGTFYYDFGLVGILVGMLVVGALFRRAHIWFAPRAGRLGPVLVYAAIVPFLVVALRDSVTDTLIRLFFVLLPLVLAVRATGAGGVPLGFAAAAEEAPIPAPPALTAAWDGARELAHRYGIAALIAPVAALLALTIPNLGSQLLLSPEGGITDLRLQPLGSALHHAFAWHSSALVVLLDRIFSASVFGLRVPSALALAAALLAAAWFGRSVVPRLPLFLGLLLAAALPTFVATGMLAGAYAPAVLVTLLVAVAAAGLVRRGSERDLVLAGAVVGLATYVYLPAVLYAALLAVTALVLWDGPWPSRLRRIARPVAGWLLVSLPAIVYGSIASTIPLEVRWSPGSMRNTLLDLVGMRHTSDYVVWAIAVVGVLVWWRSDRRRAALAVAWLVVPGIVLSQVGWSGATSGEAPRNGVFAIVALPVLVAAIVAGLAWFGRLAGRPALVGAFGAAVLFGLFVQYDAHRAAASSSSGAGALTAAVVRAHPGVLFASDGTAGRRKTSHVHARPSFALLDRYVILRAHLHVRRPDRSCGDAQGLAASTVPRSAAWVFAVPTIDAAVLRPLRGVHGVTVTPVAGRYILVVTKTPLPGRPLLQLSTSVRAAWAAGGAATATSDALRALELRALAGCTG